jgi:short-subunit dehydrogenase
MTAKQFMTKAEFYNVLSLASLAAVPFDSLYSISKAAAFSRSQSLRALLAGRGVSVHAVLPGPIDTDMARGLDIPKASLESAARAILDGLEKGDEEIFPDPMSERVELWAAQFAQEDYLRLVRRVTTYTGDPLSEAGYTDDQPAEAEVTA